jgi:flagellar protein FliL
MKALIKMMIFIVFTVVVLLGGYWGYLKLSSSNEQTQERSADSILATMVETEHITTNLNSDGFIQLRFKIQTSSVKAKKELVKRDFQVSNIALRIASSMTEEQVKSPDGMVEFEKKMMEELNTLMQNGNIVKIYTTNKMIQ